MYICSTYCILTYIICISVLLKVTLVLYNERKSKKNTNECGDTDCNTMDAKMIFNKCTVEPQLSWDHQSEKFISLKLP